MEMVMVGEAVHDTRASKILKGWFVEGERGLGVFEAGFGFVWFGELHMTRESRAFFVLVFE